jgi:hypothetical protein
MSALETALPTIGPMWDGMASSMASDPNRVLTADDIKRLYNIGI